MFRQGALDQYWRTHLKRNDTVILGLPFSAITFHFQGCIQMLHEFCIKLVASSVLLRWLLLLIL